VIAELLRTFWNDGKVEILVILIALDFFLGVLAALRAGTFRLSYVADFLRKDVLFKMGSYLVLYAGAYFAGQADIVIDGLDIGVLAGAAYAVVLAAMVGSILNSLKELGLIPRVSGAAKAPSHDVVGMATADEGI
jgi:hypothetical protein